MTERICVGAWLPNEWGQRLTDQEKIRIRESEINLLLIPENHDQWANRDEWKQLADELEIAIYAGFEDGDWIRALYYEPTMGTDFTYTKHSSAGKLDLEREEWHPDTALKTIDLSGTTIGTTICHDHYFAPLMGYEGLAGASLLANLSATPVKRKKWGEVLQARAIENAAYVVCTLHGTGKDGSRSRGSHAHVFAFNPYGDPLRLTELETNSERKLFETTPDNIYTFYVDSPTAANARETLTSQEDRPEISRIQTSSSESSEVSEPRFSVQVEKDCLQIADDTESVEITDFTSQSFSLGKEQFYLAVIEGEEVLKPERLYRIILSVPEIENKRILILNPWSDLSERYHRNVVEPILRARCIEWASPAIAVAPSHKSAYQVWYAKNTSRMNPDEEGRFQFYLYAARGVSSALDPVHHEVEKLLQLTTACEDRRSKQSSTATIENP